MAQNKDKEIYDYLNNLIKNLEESEIQELLQHLADKGILPKSRKSNLAESYELKQKIGEQLTKLRLISTNLPQYLLKLKVLVKHCKNKDSYYIPFHLKLIILLVLLAAGCYGGYFYYGLNNTVYTYAQHRESISIKSADTGANMEYLVVQLYLDVSKPTVVALGAVKKGDVLCLKLVSKKVKYGNRYIDNRLQSENSFLNNHDDILIASYDKKKNKYVTLDTITDTSVNSTFEYHCNDDLENLFLMHKPDNHNNLSGQMDYFYWIKK